MTLRHYKMLFYPLSALMLSAFLASGAYAAGPFQVADASVSAKRFMSLASARTPAASARVVNPARVSGLHSDTSGMKKGFMRLDRDMLVINVRKREASVAVTRPNPQQTQLEQVANVSASDDPVLGLFGTADEMGGEPQFGSTMRTMAVRGHAWPIPTNAKQYVSSGFGMRKDPFTGRPKFHGGMDIAAATGTPVLASADGVVSEVASSRGGMGNSVSITHRDGSISTYGHLSAQTVRKGQNVRQGQQVGKVGSTGRSTGAHLDYRIKKNGQRLDPAKILSRSGTTMRVAQATR